MKKLIVILAALLLYGNVQAAGHYRYKVLSIIDSSNKIDSQYCCTYRYTITAQSVIMKSTFLKPNTIKFDTLVDNTFSYDKYLFVKSLVDSGTKHPPAAVPSTSCNDYKYKYDSICQTKYYVFNTNGDPLQIGTEYHTYTYDTKGRMTRHSINGTGTSYTYYGDTLVIVNMDDSKHSTYVYYTSVMPSTEISYRSAAPHIASMKKAAAFDLLGRRIASSKNQRTGITLVRDNTGKVYRILNTK